MKTINRNMIELFKTETQKRRESLRHSVKSMFTEFQGRASNNILLKTIEANLGVSAPTAYRWLVEDGLIVPKRRARKEDKALTDKNAGE